MVVNEPFKYKMDLYRNSIIKRCKRRIVLSSVLYVFICISTLLSVKSCFTTKHEHEELTMSMDVFFMKNMEIDVDEIKDERYLFK